MAATKKKAGRKKVTRKKATRGKTMRKKASRKKATRAGVTRKKAGRPKGSKNKRGVSLSRMTTSALAAELDRRRRRLPMLQRQHADLANKLASLEAKIAEMGGATGGGATRGRRPVGRPAGRPVGSGGGKRPRNAKNLEDTLADTLRGKTMSVTDATAAVQARGYKTTAANFRTIVNATLLKSKKIKKISRGQYTAK